MLKGIYFEKQIEKVINYVNSTGGHGHKNYAYRLEDGTYIKGEPFDYEIFIQDYHCVFDAKECATSTWHMLKKDIVQADNLKKCKNVGLNAYFLIYFENKDVMQIDIDDVIKILKSGKKSIPKSLGKEWKLIKILKGGE